MGIKVREKQKGSGVFYVFINFKGHRSAKCVGSFKAATAVAEQLQAMITLGEFRPDTHEKEESPTLRVYSKTWLSDQIAEILDDETHERYGYVLDRDILPAMGDLPVDQIGPKVVRDLLNKLSRDGRTSKSISLTRTVLSSCLNEAVIDGLLKTNPVKDLSRNRRRSKVSDTRRERVHRVNPFTPDEVSRFITWAMEADPVVYGPMFLCGFRTGLRLGELIALHWEDIDWERSTIHIHRSYKNRRVRPVKTGEPRSVDMSNQLRNVLADLLKKQKLTAAKTGGWQIPEMIFSYKGNYRAQNTVRKAFKTFLKRAGLREIRVHDMRHTYASLLISKGISLAYVKDQLGHSSIKITIDIYGHLIPGSMQHVVNDLDQVSSVMPPAK